MGFSNDSRGGSGKFANFSKGKITTKIDGEKKTFSTLTGTLTAIYIEDAEYDKKEYRKVNLLIAHEDGETILGFPLSSGYGNAFCRILPNITIGKDISISPGLTPDKDNAEIKRGTVFIEQGGKPLKWYFSSKTNNEIPDVEETKVGTGKNAKIVRDYSKREDFFERMITKYDDKLQKMFGKKEKPKPKTADEVTEPIDDLPF